uniref:PID domain-containing protein n=1 Tax=Rhabditophanes sp. KR3021 TaxID=114890 RepID=A0AC35UDT2_9BILA
MKDPESKSNFIARSWARLSKRKSKKHNLKYMAEEAFEATEDDSKIMQHVKSPSPSKTDDDSPLSSHDKNVSTIEISTGGVYNPYEIPTRHTPDPFVKKMDKLDRFKKSIRKSFRLKPKDKQGLSFSEAKTSKNGSSSSTEKPSAWLPDELSVRNGVCSFAVKYYGQTEVIEGRGINVCEAAMKILLNKKTKPIKAILYVSGDGLRVVGQSNNQGLIVDQTIEKVSFCAPDRNNDAGFCYISRDGTSRRWICHGFMAVKETGERLSHAVGCAFSICLEKKKKREEDAVVASASSPGSSVVTSIIIKPDGSKTITSTPVVPEPVFGHGNKGYQSFRRQMSLTDRYNDPQSAKVTETLPIKNGPSSTTSKPRPLANPALFERQASLRTPESNIAQSFKRLHSLRTELPSRLKNGESSIRNVEPIWEDEEVITFKQSTMAPSISETSDLINLGPPVVPQINLRKEPIPAIPRKPAPEPPTSSRAPPPLPEIHRNPADLWLQEAFLSTLSQNSARNSIRTSVSLTSIENSNSPYNKTKESPTYTPLNCMKDYNPLNDPILPIGITETHIFDSPRSNSLISSNNTTIINNPVSLGYKQFRNSMEYHPFDESEASHSKMTLSASSSLAPRDFPRLNSVQYVPLRESSSSIVDTVVDSRPLDIFGQPVFAQPNNLHVFPFPDTLSPAKVSTTTKSGSPCSLTSSNTQPEDPFDLQWTQLTLKIIFVTFCIQQLPSYLEAYRGLDYNKKLERDLLKNYNRKNRPVKSSDTVIQVAVQLMITHVENVDQKEQTIHLHGQIYSSWKDEYMAWEPSKYNNTQYILMEAYNLWQPALTLTNNAKSSSWNLHLSSVPAIITSDGTVRVTGVFTFYVTCSFDYSNYPYDEQECPIAITEWIYDASKVNLSDSELNAEVIKPLIRLSFDPIRNESKKHSSGWEITDTWKKHLYWGPDGVDEKIPNTVQLDWYWSVLEFGIKLKRHEPYFWSIIMFPTLISIILILISFWTEDIQLAYHLNITTIIFLGLHAWDIISRLPPGNGSVPKIVYLYGTHLSISLATYFLHVLMMHLVQTLPDDEVKFPVKINEIVAFLKGIKIFQIKGISFDPQRLVN